MTGKSLESHLKITFSLTNNGRYTYSDIESMAPWERDHLVSLILEDIRSKNNSAPTDDGGYAAYARLMAEQKKNLVSG
jgi:hypothetical protein